MTKTKSKSVIEFIRIKCENCNESADYAWKDIELNSHSDQCDLCGSHGSTEVMFFCRKCNKYSDIETSSW